MCLVSSASRRPFPDSVADGCLVMRLPESMAPCCPSRHGIRMAMARADHGWWLVVYSVSPGRSSQPTSPRGTGLNGGRSVPGWGYPLRKASMPSFRTMASCSLPGILIDRAELFSRAWLGGTGRVGNQSSVDNANALRCTMGSCTQDGPVAGSVAGVMGVDSTSSGRSRRLFMHWPHSKDSCTRAALFRIQFCGTTEQPGAQSGKFRFSRIHQQAFAWCGR